MTTPNHTPEQQATCHISLEKSLKEFLSNALAELQNRILLEMRNMLLEHDKEVGKIMNKQDTEISLLKQEIITIKGDTKEDQEKMNDFKRETRERLGLLENTQSSAKGALGFGSWLVGSGIIGGLLSIGVIAYKVLGSMGGS